MKMQVSVQMRSAQRALVRALDAANVAALDVCGILDTYEDVSDDMKDTWYKTMDAAILLRKQDTALKQALTALQALQEEMQPPKPVLKLYTIRVRIPSVHFTTVQVEAVSYQQALDYALDRATESNDAWRFEEDYDAGHNYELIREELA